MWIQIVYPKENLKFSREKKISSHDPKKAWGPLIYSTQCSKNGGKVQFKKYVSFYTSQSPKIYVSLIIFDA